MTVNAGRDLQLLAQAQVLGAGGDAHVDFEEPGGPPASAGHAAGEAAAVSAARVDEIERVVECGDELFAQCVPHHGRIVFAEDDGRVAEDVADGGAHAVGKVTQEITQISKVSTSWLPHCAGPRVQLLQHPEKRAHCNHDPVRSRRTNWLKRTGLTNNSV